MAFRVKHTEQSYDDLDGIIEYISEELFNPQAAERFYNNVAEKIERLKANPYMFPLYHDEKLNAKGFRFAVIGNYLMFFAIDERDGGNKIVNILRIIYGRRDMHDVFND
ncbi:MAG: type II toxin-antitoxin system RelE/ParE family toxin [Defluviitaleaceae bacterium]|nr:type II toxin-antitoxin system RelE/ParE family toxin [Defluviitaleaceae bacterium]